MADPDAEHLLRAYRSLGRLLASGASITPIIGALRHLLGGDVILVDTRGSVLAARPARSGMDPFEVVSEASRPSGNNDFRVARVELDGKLVAVLATTAPGQDELLGFAASLIAKDLLAHQSEINARDRAAAIALNYALHEFDHEPEAARRLAEIGISVDVSFRMLVGRVTKGHEKLGTIPWNLHALVEAGQPAPHRMLIDSEVIMLVPDDVTWSTRAPFLLDRLRTLDEAASVGVSEPRHGVAGLRLAYFEARAAARAGCGIQAGVSPDVLSALLLQHAVAEVRAAIERTLQPLADYDSARSGELIATLTTWLSKDRSIPETARALYIHPNSLRYRLELAEKLLGKNLQSTDCITNLNLALHFQSLGKES